MEKIYRVQMNSNGMPNFSTAVEVADKPQGEWINIDTILFKAQCSVCNTWSDVMGNYCPNCGARMKGADE